MCVVGDLEGCEGLAESVIEANTAMIPLYEKIEGVMDSSNVDCSLPDGTSSRLWGELRASVMPTLSTDVEAVNRVYTDVDHAWNSWKLAKSTRINKLGKSYRVSLAEMVNAYVQDADTIEIIETHPWLSQLDRLTDQHMYTPFCSPLAARADVPLQQDHANDVVIDSLSDEVQVFETVSDANSLCYRLVSCTMLALCLGVVWVLVVVLSSKTYFNVINNDERAIQCQCQNYAQLITKWLVQDLMNTVGRSRQLLALNSTTVDFSGSMLSGTFAAAVISMMNTSNPVVGVYGSLFATWKQRGDAFSVDYNEFEIGAPVAHLYRHDSGLCWEAPYSSNTGYGKWAQTATGPLNTSCAAVTSAAWYLGATALSSGANSTTTGTISSGYIGITHMVHETSHNVVFGGEMDGRTLSNNLNHGKPVQGEIYVVSATASLETLVAATESTIQSQLESTSAVDPSTVGNLVGSSASSLKSSFGSFFQMWSRSASVPMADSHGQVATRCPSSTSPAYIALGASKSLYSSSQSASLQPFQTQTNLQLMLVTSNPSCTCICLRKPLKRTCSRYL